MNDHLELFKELRAQGWALTRINLFIAQAVNAKNRYNWTPRHIEMLRMYWERGYSINLIGIMLGVSRNAVVGKVRRLKLRPRVSPFPKKVAHATKDSDVDAPPVAEDRALADDSLSSPGLPDPNGSRSAPV